MLACFVIAYARTDAPLTFGNSNFSVTIAAEV